MAKSRMADKFLRFDAAIRRLREQQSELVDERLYLAVCYLPAMRDQRHIFCSR
jgi:hypothetical protein